MTDEEKLYRKNIYEALKSAGGCLDVLRNMLEKHNRAITQLQQRVEQNEVKHHGW